MRFIEIAGSMEDMDAFSHHAGARSPLPRAVSILSIGRSGVVA